MQLKFKKSYKFALKSSVYVTLFFLATIFLYHYFVQSLNLLVVFAFSLIFYAATFFLIQFRVEHFIYKRVKKIYDDVSLLETTSYVNQPVTTDMATYRDWETDRKSTRLNSSHITRSRMPSSA